MKRAKVWPLLCALAACAAVISGVPGAGMARTLSLTQNTHIYLPLVASDVVPILIAPADRQPTISLAPILEWSPVITGTFQIQVSPDPAFPPLSTLPLSETKTLSHTTQQATLIATNLTESKAYYWRVGVRTPEGTFRYGATRSFTTPRKDAALLPAAVPLVAPADQTALSTDSVLLQWQALPGAKYYRVRVFDSHGVLFSAGSKEVASPIVSLELKGLQAGMTYAWKVKALNAYGWGEYGAEYHFTAP